MGGSSKYRNNSGAKLKAEDVVEFQMKDTIIPKANANTEEETNLIYVPRQSPMQLDIIQIKIHDRPLHGTFEFNQKKLILYLSPI